MEGAEREKAAKISSWTAIGQPPETSLLPMSSANKVCSAKAGDRRVVLFPQNVLGGMTRVSVDNSTVFVQTRHCSPVQARLERKD
jgi:hypothetical protein